MSKNKNHNSPVPTAQEIADWGQFYGHLSEADKNILDAETKALHDHLHHGSKFSVARNFATVREVLAPNRSDNAATKKNWGLYLKVHHFSGVSRATGYRLMDAYDVAKAMFPETFLDALATSGYALGLNPSAASPLGKFTSVARGFEQLQPTADLSPEEAADLVNQVVIEWEKNKPKPSKKGRAEAEVAYCVAALKSLHGLTKRFMTRGQEPTTGDLLEELGVLVAHLYHTLGKTDEAVIEPQRITVKENTTAPDADSRTPMVTRPSKAPAKKVRKVAVAAEASEQAPVTADDNPVDADAVPRKPPQAVKLADIDPGVGSDDLLARAHAAAVANDIVD